MNALQGRLRDLEDELQRCHAAGREYATLARETGLPLDVVVGMVARAGDRLLGSRRERDRRARSQTRIESFEQREERLVRRSAPRTTNRPWLATHVSIRLDEAVDRAGQTAVRRECPVCLREFTGGRADRLTCGDHCRDLARRIRNGDPGVEAAVRMLFAPSACHGCGEPLWAKRPDARHHGPACVKRAQRARRDPGEEVGLDKLAEAA